MARALVVRGDFDEKCLYRPLIKRIKL